MGSSHVDGAEQVGSGWPSLLIFQTLLVSLGCCQLSSAGLLSGEVAAGLQAPKARAVNWHKQAGKQFFMFFLIVVCGRQGRFRNRAGFEPDVRPFRVFPFAVADFGLPEG